jgi:rare lipoprotein A
MRHLTPSVPSPLGRMGWRWCLAAAVVIATLLGGCASAPNSRPAPPISTQSSSAPTLPSLPAPAELGDKNATPSSTTPQSAASNPTSEREDATGWQESGIASWYGPGFHGKRTASGERFNTNELTAAHKTLPFGTRVRVKSQVNGKQVVVRINDRGPFIKGRIIDLSQAAAQALGLTGIKQVIVERLR